MNPGNESSSEGLKCAKGWGECGGFSSRSNNNLSEILWEFVGKKCYMLFWNEIDKDELHESTKSKHLQFPLKRTASSLIHWEICYRSSKLTREHLFFLLLFFASFN